MTEKKPFEIARETLKQLTARKLVPTPLNYQSIYNEIAGIPQMPPFPVDTLRDIAKALPAKTPGQQRQKGLLLRICVRDQRPGLSANKKKSTRLIGGCFVRLREMVTTIRG